MQSVMQMFVARFASRNPCILWMVVLLKKPMGTSARCTALPETPVPIAKYVLTIGERASETLQNTGVSPLPLVGRNDRH
jgi:hypothetical protein